MNEVASAGQGFALGMSLIVAIGAQNAFVLRQGIARRHVLPIVLFCASSDAVLIAVGAAGFGTLVASNPQLLMVAGLGGSLFLTVYGISALVRALHPQAMTYTNDRVGSLWKDLATVAALTFLNPHVFLDTVIVLGGIAGQYPAGERVWFAVGAMAASVSWFFGLGYGARFLIPIFAKPLSWRVLDVAIGIVMMTIAYGLVVGVVSE